MAKAPVPTTNNKPGILRRSISSVRSGTSSVVMGAAIGGAVGSQLGTENFEKAVLSAAGAVIGGTAKILGGVLGAAGKGVASIFARSQKDPKGNFVRVPKGRIIKDRNGTSYEWLGATWVNRKTGQIVGSKSLLAVALTSIASKVLMPGGIEKLAKDPNIEDASGKEHIGLTLKTFNEYRKNIFKRFDDIIQNLLLRKKAIQSEARREDEKRIEAGSPENDGNKKDLGEKQKKDTADASIFDMSPSQIMAHPAFAAITASVAGVGVLLAGGLDQLGETVKSAGLDDIPEVAAARMAIDAIMKAAPDGAKALVAKEGIDIDEPAPVLDKPAPAESSSSSRGDENDAGNPVAIAEQQKTSIPTGDPERVAGLDTLKFKEGFKPLMYKDGPGHSVGYGHFLSEKEKKDNKIALNDGSFVHLTNKDGTPRPITEAEASKILQQDSDSHNVRTAANLKGLGVDISKLDAGTQAAIFDLGFNAGSGIFYKAPNLVASLKRNDKAGILRDISNIGRNAGQYRIGERLAMIKMGDEYPSKQVAQLNASAKSTGNSKLDVAVTELPSEVVQLASGGQQGSRSTGTGAGGDITSRNTDRTIMDASRNLYAMGYG